MRVSIITVPEAMASTITGPADVLATSSVLWAELAGIPAKEKFIIDLVSETVEPFQCFNGFHIFPDQSVEDIEATDLIIIPSLVIPPHGLNDKHPKLVKWIHKMYRQGSTIASICTGSFLLAETGLLNQKTATTHWAYVDAFKENYPAVELCPEKSIVILDRIYCVGAGSAWHDLVFKLIRDTSGHKVATHVTKMFLMQNHDEGQQPFTNFIDSLEHNDATILDAQKWISDNFMGEDLINRCSEFVGLNVKTFKHRFKQALNISPLQYIQKLRIERAKDALELTKGPVEEISLAVGYQDTSFFRRVFKRETGLSPSTYRKKFGIRSTE